MLEEATEHADDADVLGELGHAGAQAADAADDEIDFHARLRCVVERLDHRPIDESVHLQHDTTGGPGRRVGGHAAHLGDDPLAQIGRRDEQLAVALRPAESGQVVEEVGDVGGDVGPAREEAGIGVQPRRARVVVAGADVHVAADAAALAPHDERALGVRLERREAVHHVHARALERARPADVAGLVEARLELDQHDRLLALLGRAHERRHHRRVARGAVDRVLDGEHVRVVDGLLDEALDRGREAVVRVVDEDVALADRAEDVGRLVALAAQPRARHALPLRIAQVGPVDAGELDEVGEVEHPVDGVDVGVVGVQVPEQLMAHGGRHRGRQLDAHDLAEAPSPQLVLDRREQVVGGLLDLEVGVARDAERGVLLDLHAREERVEVLGDEILERDELRAAVAHRQEARQHLRHLHAREAPLAGGGIMQRHAEREREVRDVREGPPGPDRERGQDGEDRAVVGGRELAAVGGRDRRDGHDGDAGGGQLHEQVGGHAALPLDELAHARADAVEHLGGEQVAGGARAVGRVAHRVEQLGHAHHAELVEVGREDRREAQPLEQRARGRRRRARARARPTRATRARGRRAATSPSSRPCGPVGQPSGLSCDQRECAGAEEPAQLAARSREGIDQRSAGLRKRDAGARERVDELREVGIVADQQEVVAVALDQARETSPASTPSTAASSASGAERALATSSAVS